eukprot:11345146-Prorocentrum_lima.AAC.1
MPAPIGQWRCSTCGFSNWPRNHRCYGCNAWLPHGQAGRGNKGNPGAPLARRKMLRRHLDGAVDG